MLMGALMMRVAIVLLGTFVVLAPSGLHAAESILICTFSYGATFDPKGQDDVAAEVDKKESWSVIFAGLDSGSPKMRGNMGETPLRIIRSNPSTLWLAEEPPLGGVNLWTIFLDTRIAILSKQYLLIGRPFGMMSMGHCK